jgi:glycosyltransferase involved in cell wall biosynthesis
MTSRATSEAIRSIMRRQHTRQPEKLNILTFCTHERYEQQLCKTGHNFYCINHGKKWDTDYGEVPENYHILDNPPSSYVDIDLVLCHTACERLDISKRIRSDLNIPIVLHTHTLPDIRGDVTSQIEQFKNISADVDQVSFISDFSRSAWGYDNTQRAPNCNGAVYIEHGIDCDFWMNFNEVQRDNVCLSVVNEWPNRDWCCGWELWKQTSENLPNRVFGKSPGLSEPADSIEHLRQIYHSSSIFYNTSLHSPVPTVLMEAMACGCAVVSTATCMIPEIIDHGKNGLISNDPSTLRSMLETLLSNPDMARNLGKNAQKTIRERYNLTHFINGWNNFFYSAIEQYKE